MPPQPRNDLTVSQLPGIDTIRVNLINEHRFESRLYLSLEQAETLRGELDEVLERAAEEQLIWR